MAFTLRKPPSLVARHEAYAYQLDALRAVKALPYAAIFHEQGLGKTKIAIDLMLLWLSNDLVDTVFVITKKSLVQNWFDELTSHSYVTPRILSDNRRENSLALNSPVLIYIMNYEAISANLHLIEDFLITCRVGAILDESHKIKNPQARASICLHSIADKFSRKVIMTGTPVANRPYDLWSQVKFLDGGQSLGSSFADFKATFDLPGQPSCTQEYSERLSNIIDKIRHFSVRETKRTVELSLPDKTILTHFVNMAPRQAVIYDSYVTEAAYEINLGDDLILDNAEDILKRLLRLVECASNPFLVDKRYSEVPGKFSELLKLLQEIDLRAHKVVLWTGFVDNVEWITAQLKEFSPLKVHGRMSIEQRNQSISRFKTHQKHRVFVATPGSAKEGLTLTVANHAVFYDRSFSLDDYLQAQDRIHRISQTEDCYVHNLIAKQTVDEWVDALLNAKHIAAQLSQGDISQAEFESSFTFNLAEILADILTSRSLASRSQENGKWPK